MGNYLRTTYLYAVTTLRRMLRDPLASLIFFGIPIALLVLFGFFLGGGDQNINVRTAIVNNSSEQFASEFEQALRDIDVLRVSDDTNFDAARQQLKDGELDTIIELPADFGQTNAQNVPTGQVDMYLSQADTGQTGQIVGSIINSVTDEFNWQLVGVNPPLEVAQQSLDGGQAQAIQHIFPIFSGLGLILIGTVGIASTIPGDRKSKILRRFKVTPMNKSQAVLGIGLAFSTLNVGLFVVMAAIAMLMFGMDVTAQNVMTLVPFVLLGTLSLVGLGLAIGAWAKTTTQGEGAGQVIFLVSMGLSGIWFPVAMMPEVLQGIVAFMPLTPVIDGIRLILIDSATLVDLLPQLAVILGWGVVTYIVSFKIFSWE